MATQAYGTAEGISNETSNFTTTMIINPAPTAKVPVDIAGIVVGSIMTFLGFVVITGLLVLLCVSRKKKKDEIPVMSVAADETTSTAGTDIKLAQSPALFSTKPKGSMQSNVSGKTQ
ncbi:unnamed protein product [Didymodactylos carnosus]|uniref:Uncharacterized protein n=1 Tax=Didymodactylos carnosus TaxID=1234261 RepID=A0A814ADK2_9BILA|nr:unnamed protein product [Didymodactylos carnosus]CAF1205391.1 unnamed protein product [Didymodactylos carnosus]CAF3693490.1 unnamed protein product [Didymodactylos carnosus]CAF4014806.1 unnamed protein product [Didymodactylos carnosus]